MNLLPYTAGRVFNTPLMISRPKLDTIMNVIAPRMQGEPLPFALPPEDREYTFSSNGIAVIPVLGTLVRRTIGLEAQSGLTSYVSLEDQLDAALNDASIKGILLDIDSPGGESGGVFDLADKIYAARAIKPIWASVNEDAFSAAYAIAAAAEQIYIPRTGGVGSIGVIAMHLDESKAEEEAGLTYTAVFAGARKNDMSPHEPLSDPARAQLQAEVRRVYKILTGSIARMRGIDQTDVEKTEAALYFGENALTVGLADRIGTFSDALHALTQKVSTTPHNSKGENAMAVYAEEHNPEKEKDQDEESKAARRRAEVEDDEDEENPKARRRSRAEKDEDEENPKARRRSRAEKDEDEDDGEETSLLETSDEDDEEEEEKDPPATARKRGKAKRSAIRKEALAYMAEVNDLCLLAGRPDRAAAFISKAVPLSVVRKSLLNAKAAQDDATAIMGHAPQGRMSRANREPTIDTAAIYAQRNKKP